MKNSILSGEFAQAQRKNPSSLVLDDGSRIAVIGGGPAGSFFSYFLLDMAERAGHKIEVTIFEPRDFNVAGPLGCNMCGGVIYESLVQSLAVEGINLPTTVVQRGIEYNMLHLDIGSVKIHAVRQEKRIASTFRGAGPRGQQEIKSGSLDGFLMRAAVSKGARHVQNRVREVRWFADPETIDLDPKRIQITTDGQDFQTYDFLAVTSGVNTAILRQFQNLDFGYQIPQTTRLLVREYYLGEEVVSNYLGPVFHAFLLDIPGLDYGAIIPKGKFLSVCLLSSHGDLDTEALDAFLDDPAVKSILPPDFSSTDFACHCSPRINVMGCAQPFGDRIVFIGDSGVSRLYKDGIGAAYRAAKIAAATAVFQGISENDFRQHYLPFCRKIETDNWIGKFLFRAIRQVQRFQIARRAIMRMVDREQKGNANAERGMSMVMWDMLTGGAPYRDVLKRVLHPVFWSRFLWNLAISLFSSDVNKQIAYPSGTTRPHPIGVSQSMETNTMAIGALGKLYQDGQIIIRQGEKGDCMYVVQEGFVEVFIQSGGKEVQLNKLGKDEFFGEMAIFEQEIRTASVRALGPVRLLSVDHKNLLQRIHEDPSLAYRLMKVMSNRIDKLNEEVARLQHRLA